MFVFGVKCVLNAQALCGMLYASLWLQFGSLLFMSCVAEVPVLRHNGHCTTTSPDGGVQNLHVLKVSFFVYLFLIIYMMTVGNQSKNFKFRFVKLSIIKQRNVL